MKKKYSITTKITLIVILILLVAGLLILFLAEHGVHAPVLGAVPVLAMHRYSLLLIIAVACVSGALAYSIIHSTMKKLEFLSVQIEHAAAEGVPQPLQNSYKDQEIIDLVTAFNEMTQKLNETIAVQMRFSAHIAHEFRTPLAIMQANIDLYRKKNPPLSEDGDQLLQLITLQIRRLSHLSEELLELSSLKQSDCDGVIHLDQLVGDVIEDLSLRIASKNLAVHYHPEHLLMRGSAELLYRAVYNVVENAVKYSEKKGTVEIALFYEAGRNVVQVADEGCGIEQGEEEKIFEPFYRGKQTVKDGEGLGLGLALVKSIVHVHHGNIHVSGRKPKGTVFTLSFQVDSSC